MCDISNNKSKVIGGYGVEPGKLLYIPYGISLSDDYKLLSNDGLGRVNVYSQYHRGDQLVMLIDIGFRYTNVALCKDNEIYHSRYFALGGRDFTESFVTSKRVSFKEAEKIKAGLELADIEVKRVSGTLRGLSFD